MASRKHRCADCGKAAFNERCRQCDYAYRHRVFLANRVETFWARVDKDCDGGCWEWTGGLGGGGYGTVWIGERQIPAHRFAYEQSVGPIPDGLHLDHLCRNRRCVNPVHLEPVTPQENNLRSDSPSAVNARKTHCKRGHEFTPENTRFRPTGGRECRECRRTHYNQNATAALERSAA